MGEHYHLTLTGFLFLSSDFLGVVHLKYLGDFGFMRNCVNNKRGTFIIDTVSPKTFLVYCELCWYILKVI